MADKQISDLTAATAVQTSDLLVIEQGGVAKKLPGQVLINFLTTVADGHGGIQSIAKTSSTGTNPVVDTYTITYADTTSSTFTVTNGVKGNTGDSCYVHIKYASTCTGTPPLPASDADMGITPDEWMGIYSGTASSAPATRSSYKWYKIKGDIGTPSSLNNEAIEYQVGATGTVAPSGSWQGTVPIVPSGQYLWTRVTLNFNTGLPVVFYSVSRNGVDGEGAAGSATPLVDVAGGAVGSSLAFAREDHQHPVPTLHISASLTTLPTTINNAAILGTMRVINCTFGTPSSLTSDVAWSTSDGSIALSGTLATGGSTTIDLDLAIF